jgi:hypothetical protein
MRVEVRGGGVVDAMGPRMRHLPHEALDLGVGRQSKVKMSTSTTTVARFRYIRVYPDDM